MSLIVKQCLIMHGETENEDDYFIRSGKLAGGSFLPSLHHLVDLFDEIQLNPGDPGFPLAEVESIAWSTALDVCELHLHCDVMNGFWYDRPWRQHLKATGWMQLDDEGNPKAA